MNRWISKTMRPKNQIFICPMCRNEAVYIDGRAKEKLSTKKAECKYRFCPWCGKEVNK